MNHVLAFLAILAAGSATTFDSGFRVKFNVGLGVGEDFFYDLPRTVGNATTSGWLKSDRPTSALPTLVMYCYDPPHICCLYDPETEYIAGVQIGLPLNKFTGAVYDWTIQGFIPWTRTTTNGTVTYMTKQMYLISEETLKKSKEERLKAFLENKILQEDAVWPVGYNQERMKVSTNATGIVKNGFTKQNCIPWMGTHYFYNMTTDTECSASGLLNWFTLVDSGNVIGIGMLVVGVMPEVSGEKFFFERPSQSAVKLIVNTLPTCLENLAGDPTVTTMHLYFIDKPWRVGCWSL